MTGRFHRARDALLPSEMSVWVFVSWFIASAATVSNFKLLLLLHVLPSLPFYKLGAVSRSSGNYLSEAHVLRQCCVISASLLLQSEQRFPDVCHIWISLINGNIIYMQCRPHEASIPNFIKKQLEFAGI